MFTTANHVKLLGTIAAVLLACGCNQSPSVTGSVTYNGEPVQKGYITFRPSDGHGQSFAAPIADGQYTATKASPGQKTVVVTGVKEINFYKSSAESYKKAEEARARGETWMDHVAERADYIAEDAEGNSQQVEIQPGSQTLDFHIKGPERPQ